MRHDELGGQVDVVVAHAAQLGGRLRVRALEPLVQLLEGQRCGSATVVAVAVQVEHLQIAASARGVAPRPLGPLTAFSPSRTECAGPIRR